MSERADALARRIEEGAAQLAALAEHLTDTEWATPVLPDGRTAGVIVHHVASVYPIEVELAEQIGAGRDVDGVTWRVIADMNANHAHEHAGVSRADALALLKRNSRAAAEAVRRLTDDQLDRATRVSLYANAPVTAQFFIEDHALRHSWHHFARISTALGRSVPQAA